MIESKWTDFSKTPEEPQNLQFLFVRIFLRIGGGHFGLRLHFQNMRNSEVDN